MYKNKKIVVFGVSQDPSKYGHKIFDTLQKRQFSVYGINPKGGSVNGSVLYTDISQLPVKAEVAIMVIPPAFLTEAVKACITYGIKEIWFQPGAQLPEALELAVKAKISAYEACFMAENGLW